MTVKEWLGNYEFQEVWECMQAKWPTETGHEDLYRDIFSILKSVHIQSEGSYLYLGFNKEGEIDNRMNSRDFYNPSKISYTDIWEFSSQRILKEIQDDAFSQCSDLEFTAALLRYAGNTFITSAPYTVPKLINPFISTAYKLTADAKQNRNIKKQLAQITVEISENWNLWYSLCHGITFKNKREAMEFKEIFLHSRNLQ